MMLFLDIRNHLPFLAANETAVGSRSWRFVGRFSVVAGVKAGATSQHF
jgi:hypothetical protein